MPLNRVWMPSPNYSSRGGAGVRLIVLHTAEGSKTYQSLGNYFASSSSGVSSHVGIDDTPNTVGEYVRRDQKAWTQGNANPVAVSASLCAFAAWTGGMGRPPQHARVRRGVGGGGSGRLRDPHSPPVTLASPRERPGGVPTRRPRKLGWWPHRLWIRLPYGRGASRG